MFTFKTIIVRREWLTYVPTVTATLHHVYNIINTHHIWTYMLSCHFLNTTRWHLYQDRLIWLYELALLKQYKTVNVMLVSNSGDLSQTEIW